MRTEREEIKTVIRSFTKINLSIDVGQAGSDGYHSVDMIMQQLAFHDDVELRFRPGKPEGSGETGFSLNLTTTRVYLPTDRRNLAFRAAELVAGRYGIEGAIDIHLVKRIPVAAGLAGGSGNAAAVIHGLNVLAGLDLGLEEILELCAELGSDIPFCAAGQARGNKNLPSAVRQDAMAVSCMRARGRGTEMTPVWGIRTPIVFAKPPLSVSTAEAYRGYDQCTVTRRPDNDQLERDLNAARGGGVRNGFRKQRRNFINVLEAYTLQAYPEVRELKERMKGLGAAYALMSGSGPTVFGIFGNIRDAQNASQALREEGLEAYWTRTMM